MPELHPGSVAWARLDPAAGREQSGRRPVVVVSSQRYLDVVTTLVVVVPVSRSDRSWPSHVRLTGIEGLVPSFAMTEQPRTISRDRLGDHVVGTVDLRCLIEIKQWLQDFLAL